MMDVWHVRMENISNWLDIRKDIFLLYTLRKWLFELLTPCYMLLQKIENVLCCSTYGQLI